jgi:hypothetical protein
MREACAIGVAGLLVLGLLSGCSWYREREANAEAQARQVMLERVHQKLQKQNEVLKGIEEDLTRQQAILTEIDEREKAGQPVSREERGAAMKQLERLQKRLHEEMDQQEKIKREAEAALGSR